MLEYLEAILYIGKLQFNIKNFIVTLRNLQTNIYIKQAIVS